LTFIDFGLPFYIFVINQYIEVGSQTKKQIIMKTRNDLFFIFRMPNGGGEGGEMPRPSNPGGGGDSNDSDDSSTTNN